ncbi:alpha/beta hydrolase [Streptomyces sp. AK04-3B]|uniref:alpha/beta hydrolase n=1 Tax=Streptomyces sp. AK04-3B TaxID=3028650 RepID=UPI0029A7603E|nr:alpha/beta hydrolase [Streptomyces sp. AK04-3B]MDX3798904.1 alpha/beta hydrolase [Streptomyces sp. AK04-3B]
MARRALFAPNRLLTYAIAVLTAAVLCSSAGPAAAAAPHAPPSPAGSSPPSIRWQNCRDLTGAPVDPTVADCAKHRVPRDYAHPADGSVEIVLLRHRATDPERRRGALFVNPGGPGSSGLHTAYRADRFLEPEVLAQYDVIGFDPRGVNLSDPLKCFRSQSEHDNALLGRLVLPVGGKQVAATMAAAARHTAACAQNAGPLLAHMTTLDAARDLDRLRQAAGESRLSFVGFSYGTLLGATYANLYPRRVDAMVLDGAVDPQLRSHDGLAYDRRRADGMELALTEFLRVCDAADDRCAFSTGDPRRRLDRILTRLRGGPLRLPDGTDMSLSAVTSLLADSLATPARLPGLARTLALLDAAPHAPRTAVADRSGPSAQHPSAHDEDAHDESAHDRASTTDDEDEAAVSEPPYRGDDSEPAYNCLDKPYPASPRTWPGRADRWERTAPHFGRMIAMESAVCATWPERPARADRYTGPWNRPTDRPVLVIGNLYDPTTQYRFAERLTEQLGRAELVTVDMIGHTALGMSACADEITTRYLLGGAPAHARVCTPDDPPFTIRD